MEEINGTITPEQYIDGHMDIAAYSSGGGGGTSNYNQLLNKPQINGVELTGNKITAQLNISYNDIYDKPFIPSSYNDLTDKPFIPTSYNELTDKPTIPTLAEIVDRIYPIGSIYITLSDFNPGTMIGGTWEIFGAGKTLVGVDVNDADFDEAGKTGGEKAHTLTVEEMPTHRHDTVPSYSSSTLSTNSNNHGKLLGAPAAAGWATSSRNDDANNHPIQTAGSGHAHNIMQPYITTYFWQRTA